MLDSSTSSLSESSNRDWICSSVRALLRACKTILQKLAWHHWGSKFLSGISIVKWHLYYQSFRIWYWKLMFMSDDTLYAEYRFLMIHISSWEQYMSTSPFVHMFHIWNKQRALLHICNKILVSQNLPPTVFVADLLHTQKEQ